MQLFDASKPIYETTETMKNASVNWAENMLMSHRWARSKTQTAVIACNEPDPVQVTEADPLAGSFTLSLTWGELYQKTAQAAATLKKMGLQPGDKVAAFVANNAEALIFLLATSSLGGVWSSCPPEFGVPAVLDRLTQVSHASLRVHQLSTDGPYSSFVRRFCFPSTAIELQARFTM